MRSPVAIAIFASFVAVAGCSRSEEFEVCRIDNPKDCDSYRSKAAFEREQARQSAKARREAERLPFDYRDLLHALLAEYLKPSEPLLSGVSQKYFISVLGNDVDDVLLKKLAASRIEVLPGSLWTLTEGHNEGGLLVTNWQIEISQIQQLTPDTFKVAFSYYCGGLCAGGLVYTLTNEGNKWSVTERHQEWAS